MNGKKGNKEPRYRNWTNVIYPESLPENFLDVITQMNIEAILSPLHDADKNADQTEKKPHYHLMVLFQGQKTFEQVKEILSPLNGTIPQKVLNAKALTRYFLHLDNPDKAQYKKSDLKSFGGVDINSILKPNSSERYELIKEIMDFIDDNQLTEITDLLQYARYERFSDWFPILCDNSLYIISKYIESKRHQKYKAKNGSD